MPFAIYLDRDSKFKTTRTQGIHYNLKGTPYKDTQIKTVYSDNTISYKGTKYQILEDSYRASYSKAKVEVLEHLNGRISILYKGRRLRYRKIGSFKDIKEEERFLEEKLLQGDISILQKR